MRTMLMAALLLAACGQPPGDFHDAFSTSAKEACVATATNKGSPANKIEPYCTCFVAQFDGLTAQEKMNLGANSPKVRDAAVACRLKVFGPDPA